MCAWHDAQAAVPGIAWDNMVHRYRGRKNNANKAKASPVMGCLGDRKRLPSPKKEA